MEDLLAVKTDRRIGAFRMKLRILCALIFVATPMSPAFAEDVEPAELEVNGYGFLGNRALMRTLELIRDPDAPQAYLTATEIGDAALLLLAQLQQDGYLHPKVEARVTLADGEVREFVWDETLLTELPHPMQASRVEFEVQPGVLFHYEELRFEGLEAIGEEEAREFFLSTGFLIETPRSRVFTSSGLESGLGSLQEVLVRRGYEQASAVASHVERDEATGEVRVLVSVEEGPLSVVNEARALIQSRGEREERELEVPAETAYSEIWAQDREQELRAEFYELGFPDTKVDSEVVERSRVDGRVLVDVVFRVDSGPYVEVGDIRFVGEEKTQEAVMKRRVELRPGDPLNRLAVNQSRFRLARLGIFEWVEAELVKVDEHTRDIVFKVEEGREIDVSLLFGYGSYEMFRFGVEVEQYNLFGRAHRSRLRLAQSMRSSSVNYQYTVPEIFGEDIHGFASAFALRREEPDFDRREMGSTVGLQTLFYRIDLDASLRYSFQLLESRAGISTGPDGLDRAFVGAVDLTLQRDLRDNPVYPESGHNTLVNIEVASDVLGGEANFQRVELGGSYHLDLGDGRFLHLGLRHGFLNTFGDVEEEIPINKRFMMGGESTIRGYLEGEASPVNEEGEFVGSETYMLLNLELEQALTERWSVVLFSDSIGFARRFDEYPFDEELFSVGLGIRYKTLIGPVRLEYGHNLNPRPEDPSGAVHLSIGFPF